MIFSDLREFIGFLEDKKELVRIKTEVDPILEVTEITDRISKKGGPALLFEKVKGSEMPLVINLFGSYERMSWALGMDDFNAMPQRFSSLLKGDLDLNIRQKLEALYDLYKLSASKPKEVKKAPVQEIVKENNFSLSDYPVLKCWPGDGGRFITLPLVITKDPESGKQNMGMYRMQVFDERTTGMHWHTHHDGAVNFRKAAKTRQETGSCCRIGRGSGNDLCGNSAFALWDRRAFFCGFFKGETGRGSESENSRPIWCRPKLKSFLRAMLRQGRREEKGHSVIIQGTILLQTITRFFM